MKEFIEQLKLYKEYVLAIAGIVAGCLLVANYFATKDALAATQKSLNRLIDERECWLNNRITVSEVSAAIANLEKERLERTRLKIDLATRHSENLSTVEKLYINEQLDQFAKDFQRIDEDLKAFRVTSRIASENLMNGACKKPEENKP